MQSQGTQRASLSTEGVFSASIVLAFVLAIVTVIVTPVVQAQSYEILYSFTGGADGQALYGGLTPDAAGNLYGSASLGGDFGAGTVYKLDPSGALSVLHSFTPVDGVCPSASLVRDPAGNLYGTAC